MSNPEESKSRARQRTGRTPPPALRPEGLFPRQAPFQLDEQDDHSAYLLSIFRDLPITAVFLRLARARGDPVLRKTEGGPPTAGGPSEI